MMPLRFIDRLKFFIERQFVKGAGFQLLVVMAVIGLISLVGGLLVVPNGDNFASLSEAVWWAFLRLTDPGYLGDDEGTWQRFISTLLTVSGYVVFLGALVAIMTRWLISVMTNLERGLTPVAYKHHIVVLSWNNRTLPLVSELLKANGRMRHYLRRHDSRKLHLVLLSEHAGQEQLLTLRSDASIGPRAKDLVLRAGSPIQPGALQRVACLDAATLIVPSNSRQTNSLAGSDVETIKALLSVASEARLHQRQLPHAVVEVQDARNGVAVRRAYPGDLEVIAGDAIISRLLIQNMLHPGLSLVLQELLNGQHGHQIYVREASDYNSHTLNDIAAYCPTAMLLGVIKHTPEGWQVQLNIPHDTTVTDADLLVFMAQHYSDTAPQAKPAALAALSAHRKPNDTITLLPRTHRILILGWHGRLPSLFEELGRYQGQTFELDIASVMAIDERETQISNYQPNPSAVTVTHHQMDYLHEEALKKLHPAQYDTIILVSSDLMSSDEEADARVMMGYLLLAPLLAEAATRPQLIIELSDPANQNLLHTHQSEMLVSPVILSHMLAQVALRRELNLVYDELFTPGGAEIIFIPAAQYGLTTEADFRAVQQAAADQGHTALGIMRHRAIGDAPRLQLNPAAGAPLHLAADDNIVILGRVTL